MFSRLSLLADPMIAVLLIATALAIVIPASGDARETAQIVSNAAIFVLFLVNGMRIARGEIARGLANWRFFLPLFLWVFGVMPLIGLGISNIAGTVLPSVVALGFLYLGTLPSTVQSATSYTSLAGGNTALSVIGAALINIAGVFITAPLFAALAGSQAAAFGTEAIVRIGLILILPFMIGQAVQGWTIDWLKDHKSKVAWIDRLVIGIAVYVAFSGAVEQGLGTMFGALGWISLIGIGDRLPDSEHGWSVDGRRHSLPCPRRPHRLPVCRGAKERCYRCTSGSDLVPGRGRRLCHCAAAALSPYAVGGCSASGQCPRA